ncbi:MAG: PEP-CTERM sorting domain-containing protein [Phycisphaerales bacterium]|nr:PEP-CTERM sorting domain-containing protein [Phycisphaerales bacterium]
MISRKFFKTHSIVLAALGMTALSAHAEVLVSDPLQVFPNSDPAYWGDAPYVMIAYDNNNSKDVTVTLNNAPGITQINTINTLIGVSPTGATGRLIVTGNGAHWTVAQELTVGHSSDSPGFLDINNGGKVTTTDLHVGNAIGSTGTITLTNGSTLTTLGTKPVVDASLIIGDSGKGTLNILSGSIFSTSTDTFLGNYAPGRGIVNVDGDGSRWNSDGHLRIGDFGHGELNISNNATVDVGNNNVLVSLYGGTGALNITSGGTLLSNTGNVGYSHTSVGTALIDGNGSAWTNYDTLNIAQYGGTGEMTVSNGGHVRTGSIAAGAGTASLHFNGGLLTALNSSDDFISGNFEALMLTDSASKPALTMQVDAGLFVDVSQVFTGTGGITKTGTGSFSLNGNQTYTGTTDVKAGKFTGDASFAGSLIVRNGATFSPGKGVWTANIAGNYTQESGATLTMDIGSSDSDKLVISGNVNLDGVLALSGSADAGFYVLIENLSDDAIDGIFSSILWNGTLVKLTDLDGSRGGGTFVIDGMTFAFSYGGDAYIGSLFGGNDLVFNITGAPVPEPASLSILGLGVATLIVRRRK